jgi:hypothetical protein
MLKRILFCFLYFLFKRKRFGVVGLKALAKLNIYCTYCNYELAALIYELMHREESERIFLSGTGVLIIVSQSKIYMIPTGPHNARSLDRSYRNHGRCQPILSELGDYLFIREVSNLGVTYYCQERLFPLRGNAQDVMALCVEKMQVPTGRCSILGLEEQRKGIEQLCMRLPSFESKQFLRALIDRYKIISLETVYIHGDLTPSNIMVNAKGNPVLIDLDRMTMHGFSFIDIIHFDISLKAKAEKLDSYIVLNDFIKRKIGREGIEFYLAYLLFRVGVECREGILLPLEYYKRIEMVILTLSEMDK